MKTGTNEITFSKYLTSPVDIGFGPQIQLWKFFLIGLNFSALNFFAEINGYMNNCFFVNPLKTDDFFVFAGVQMMMMLVLVPALYYFQNMSVSNKSLPLICGLVALTLLAISVDGLWYNSHIIVGYLSVSLPCFLVYLTYQFWSHFQ